MSDRRSNVACRRLGFNVDRSRVSSCSASKSPLQKPECFGVDDASNFLVDIQNLFYGRPRSNHVGGLLLKSHPSGFGRSDQVGQHAGQQVDHDGEEVVAVEVWHWQTGQQSATGDSSETSEGRLLQISREVSWMN